VNIFVGYVPVIHRGYLKLFEELVQELGDYPVYLLDGQLLELESISYLARDVRACTAINIYRMLRQYIRQVIVVSTSEKLVEAVESANKVVMPDEDVSQAVVERYLAAYAEKIEFVSAWLRWDKKSAVSEQAPNPDRQISIEELDRGLINQAYQLAERSSDWWRQVGALAVKDGQVLISAWNRHQPHDFAPYIDGDPRANFDWGERIDLSTAAHAEATIIAKAASRGDLSLAGASVYVTTFPCPGCAMSLALTGIKRVYYAEGYSRVDAEEHLKRAGIEIVKVIV